MRAANDTTLDGYRLRWQAQRAEAGQVCATITSNAVAFPMDADIKFRELRRDPLVKWAILEHQDARGEWCALDLFAR